MRRALALLVALAATAGCGRGLPETDAHQRSRPGHAVPAEPSEGCRPGTLPRAHGARAALAGAPDGRGYILDAPGGPADRPRSVVLSFHGFRSSAWRHRWWTGWGSLALREGFIAVTPDGHEGVELLGRRGRGWDLRHGQTHDLDFVRGLLDHLERERCVDRRRVFATGMSNGGFFANLLGCVLAERMAAVAPVAGGLPLEDCAPSRPMPVLFIHGRADRVIPVGMVEAGRDWWARAAGCGPAVERDGCAHYAGCTADLIYCEGPHGHRWPGDATGRIWRFFQAHPRA